MHRPFLIPAFPAFLARPLAVFVASCFFLVTTRPALAQAPAVQPVPYKASQPVPYAVEAPVTGTPAATAPPPPPAPRVATPVGGDVVYLKDGGMIRGVLIEAIPKDHATVQLGTGQNAIIPWHLIDHIERGAAAAPPPVSAPSSEGSAGGASAIVHVDSPDAVTVEMRKDDGPWVFACNSPCDRALALAMEYRIIGSGMRNTSGFHLSANPGEHVTVKLNASSKGAFVGGIVLVSLGPVVALIGLVVILVNSTESCSFASSASSSANGGISCTAGSGSPTGTVLALGGLAMIIGGIVMMVANARSSVTQGPTETRPQQDAWKRLPTWREDPMGAQLPRAASLPVFSSSF